MADIGNAVAESEVWTRAAEAVREQYRRIGETQRQCQAVMVAIAQVMDWGPADLNYIVGVQFFNVPPEAPLPPVPPAESKEQA